MSRELFYVLMALIPLLKLSKLFYCLRDLLYKCAKAFEAGWGWAQYHAEFHAVRERETAKEPK